jgi:hypothetical protein
MAAAARIVGEGDDGETVSARDLAKQCLRVVGTDIGAGAGTGATKAQPDA